MIRVCFGYYFDLGLKAQWGVSSDNILSKIEEMLKNDLPVPISIGPMGENVGVNYYIPSLSEDDPYCYDQVYYANADGHYVTITGLMYNEVKGQIILEMSTYGEKCYIQFDEYINAVLKYSNYVMCNIVYIEK